jgi:hypothetical protein
MTAHQVHVNQAGMRDRIAAIRNLLKEAGDHGITADEIAIILDVKPATVYDTMRLHRKEVGGTIVGTRGRKRLWKYRFLNKMKPANRPVPRPAVLPSKQEQWSYTFKVQKTLAIRLVAAIALITVFMAGMIAGVLAI